MHQEKKLYTYRAYGLGIHSELPLPELVDHPAAEPDVLIRKGQAARDITNVDAAGNYFDVGEEEAYLFWGAAGGFLVRRGREIVVDAQPGVEEDLIRLPLLGPVLANLLFQRGFLMLHASAVVINGGVVAFVGNAGQGKSTTAAALHARGYPVVTDDVLAIDLANGSGPLVSPAFPQLKLWPEAAEAALGDDPASLQCLHRRVVKRARNVADGFQIPARPLHCIYVLDAGETLAVEPIAPRDAFVAVLGLSYCMMAMENEKMAAASFPKYLQLVQRVPVRRLRRRNSLTDLPRIAQVVEDDIASLESVRHLPDVQDANPAEPVTAGENAFVL